MLTNPWYAELARVIALEIVAVLIGALSGHIALILWFATVIYLGYHLLKLHHLQSWLRAGVGPPSKGGNGIWGEVYYQLYCLRQRHGQRKRTIIQYIQRFRELTAAMPDATVVLRAGGEIEWFNDAAQRLLGLRSPQDNGQRIGNLLRHPKFADYFRGRCYSELLELVSPEDEQVVLSINIVPYGNEQMLLVARDITRIHRLEQIRRDFVANISHELRTPLTVIRGYLEALSDSNEIVPQEKQILMAMSEQSEHMCRMIDDLLLLSRLETEQRLPKTERVPVPILLTKLIEETKILSGGNHVIYAEIDQHLYLLGIADELRSAFANLLSNAVRYTPTGGNIALSWYADDQGAHFQVKDTGVGIASQHIPRLSERFYRVDVARSRQSGGTGLGLAIVKHVLERHQAKMHIESELGYGSTFTCDFPLAIMIHI